jgi:hypothetical protein
MSRPKSVDNLDEKYIGFLLTTDKQASGKAFSKVFYNRIPHDQITRMLNNTDTFSSAELWKIVKPLCREVAHKDNIIAFDDTLIEKPDTRENEVVMYHYDHTKGRSVKGYIKLELLRIKHSLSYDSLKELIRYVANQASYHALIKLSTIQNVAYKQLNLFA